MAKFSLPNGDRIAPPFTNINLLIGFSG